MTSKPMRLTTEAEGIALKYGPTVSKGIVEMEYRLKGFGGVAKMLPSECSTLATTDSIDGMPKAYWERFKKELDIFIEKAQRGY